MPLAPLADRPGLTELKSSMKLSGGEVKMVLRLMLLGCVSVSVGCAKVKKAVEDAQSEEAVPTSFSIGGFVLGNSGPLVLQNGIQENLGLTSAGQFRFTTRMSPGAGYRVTVQMQPTGQVCTVANDRGYVGAANITNVIVQCVTVNPIQLFSAGLSRGNLGGRAGADAFCAARAAADSLSCANVHAFANFGVNDQIKHMPANFGLPTNVPIQSVDHGTGSLLIQNNWVGLLGGILFRDLASAGVTTGNMWWSGALDDAGTADPANDCNGWTDSSSSASGVMGSAAASGPGWMEAGVTMCSAGAEVLCVCY